MGSLEVSGSRHGGIKGVGENPHPARVPVLWAGGCGGLSRTFHAAPGGHLAVESHRPQPTVGGQGAVHGPLMEARVTGLGHPRCCWTLWKS